MIHHLLDYCRFKEMGKVLARKAAEQSAFYYRESEEYVSPDRKPLGTDHLSISDLAKVFEESIVVAENRYGDAIEEEVFRVADKIRFLRTNLKKGDIIPLEEIFDPERSRGELVVFFLAMLELMKLGELAVVRREDQRLEVIRQESHESRNQSTRIEPGDNDYA